MKIKKIYLKNINSFKGEHRIDFTEKPLSVAGLFAIVGQTGAGKSTLLDAITLAIFNRIPRFEKTISKDFVASAGSILTRGERDCAVEIEFSCKSGDFISKWRIEINRNQHMNDYEMEIFDLQTDTLLALKKSEVPKKNEQLIGLTYDQFIKSILLSQGEFAKFLKSGKDDRGKLLEDITGTQIYRKLGKKAFDIAKEKGEKLKQFRSNITVEKSKLSSVEEEQNWINRKAEIENLLHDFTIQIEVLKTKIELKKQVKLLEKSIQEKKEKHEIVQNTLKNFEINDAPKLKNHEKAEPFQQAILIIKNQENELLNLQKRLALEEENIVKNERFLSETLAKIKHLIKTEQAITVENALTILQDFKEKISLFEKKKSELEGTKKANEAQLWEIVRKIDDKTIKIDISQLSDDVIEHLKNTGITHKNSLNESFALAQIESLEQIQFQREKLAFELKNYTDLKQAIHEYGKITDELMQEKNQAKEQNELISKNKPELEKIQKKIPLLEQKIKQLELQKEQLGKSYNFEKDRQNLLKKGEPCPLCGSLEHPFLSHYANNYVEIDLQLAQAKTDEKSEIKAINDLTILIDSAAKLSEKCQEKIGRLTLISDTVVATINALKISLAIEKVGNKESINLQLTTIEIQQNALNSLENKAEKLKDLQNLYQGCKATKLIQYAYKNLLNELKLLYSGNNFERECTEIQTHFSTFQANIVSSKTNFASIKEEILPKQASLSSKKRELEAQIQAKGFSSLENCQEAILASENAQILREKQQTILLSNQTLVEQLKEQQDELAKNKILDDNFTDLETLVQKQGEVIQNDARLKKEQVEISVNLVSQQKTKDSILGLENQLNILEKDNLKWELLDKYIGDSTGKKFSTFAQGLTLSRLIALANRRLTQLSDRYLLDKPTEQDEDELMILDLWMGNEKRSVKTLSGGETFIISLSLALALSDLASKNIKLESLFIDEGFGTLDPETLDLALNTLEKLQQEGQKNIGIISHVESIKERISTQIRLERNNRGFSRIEY